MSPTPRAVAARLPGAPGVYRFRDAQHRVLYLGRATELRRRVCSYWGDLRDRGHLAPMVGRIATVEAVVCASPHEAAWLERNLLEQAMPRWNRTPGGQESPVHIRLDVRPAAPGISVVHATSADHDAAYFGPYLGGQKVRQAAVGLHRVLPLAYSGIRLRGTERDLARRRGIGTQDRAELVATLTAVLERDPVAVRTVRDELAARRDRAATELAFELATRVQAEIEALDWITSTQRVAAIAASDADVCGWAGGVLVRFEFRAGRLGSWTQRACPRSAASRAVAGTPQGWVEFASCNAALAAALAADPA